MKPDVDFLFIQEVLKALNQLVPVYMQNKAEADNSIGHVACCLITTQGQIYGQFWGTDAILNRQRYTAAWTKASQAAITGVNTFEFERLYFNNPDTVSTNGIRVPDLIGWKGGQVLQLKAGPKLYAGFSGFSGNTDLEIVRKAFTQAETAYFGKFE